MAKAARREPDPLATYRAKRRFERTPEPRGRAAPGGGHLYTIQKHAARRLHYDLRLELDGVLKSWAVTRGPSLDPSDKRLAVRTEDHPLDYAAFEGRIPKGSYGAGTVLLWDRGEWEPLEDPKAGLDRGKLVFRLHGARLKGRWALVRFRGETSERRENWLLIKEKDEHADPDEEVTEAFTASIASEREIGEIAAAPEAVWQKGAAKRRDSSAPLPDFVSPALASLVEEMPSGGDWLFEVKFDGYRALAAVSGSKVRIYTRNGLDWTARYPEIARALGDLELDATLLDGEVVAVDAQGRADFSTLQKAMQSGRGLSYFVFDLLAEGGKSLRKKALKDRKARLRALLGDLGREGPIFFSDHVEGSGESASAEMLEALCPAGFEGIIAKRSSSPYRSGRGRDWLKVKCGRDQEFVVVGWSPSTRDRPFASLLLGAYEGGELRYAGRVGSGFSQRDLRALSRQLNALRRKTPPVAGSLPKAVARQARWVKPELVAQVAFAEFTRDGLVRQARFLGLREDKPAATVERERPPASEEVPMETEKQGPRLTNPDKVLFPQQGITKRDLAQYLDRVAEPMLEHLAGRLVSLVRCPEGRAKVCFFQRHAGRGLPKAFKEVSLREKDGEETVYIYIEDAAGLAAAAQMGVLEFHIWGAQAKAFERPDRLVFDLDPDAAVAFEEVKAAAKEFRDALDALGLESFPLLTGGKGIHVVAPLAPRHDWATVKAFAKALAQRFAENDPGRYVATMRKAKRKGRIFVDYLRNEQAATAIAPYSPRARKGAPVAWPVDWDDLDSVEAAAQIKIGDVNPGFTPAWSGYGKVRQSLKSASLRALGVV